MVDCTGVDCCIGRCVVVDFFGVVDCSFVVDCSIGVDCHLILIDCCRTTAWEVVTACFGEVEY